VRSSEFAAFGSLIEDIEKLSIVVEVDPCPQTPLRVTDRQIANRLRAPCCFGADSGLSTDLRQKVCHEKSPQGLGSRDFQARSPA
jgi:hypothetical protein